LAQPLDAFHGRRLAGPVRADHADDLTSGDGEVHTVHHDPLPVRLAQTSHGHHIVLNHASMLPGQYRLHIGAWLEPCLYLRVEFYRKLRYCVWIWGIKKSGRARPPGPARPRLSSG